MSFTPPCILIVGERGGYCYKINIWQSRAMSNTFSVYVVMKKCEYYLLE